MIGLALFTILGRCVFASKQGSREKKVLLVVFVVLLVLWLMVFLGIVPIGLK